VKEFDTLVAVVAQLRHPVDGCPWDLKQTHTSLVPNFIEELYEAVEAIENNDSGHLSEELGDLLLHILMQARISEEAGEFDMADVCRKISEKLIHRHPHIFGDGPATDAKGVKMNWERIKQQEKKATRTSAIDGIPTSMPGLIVAQRMQEKAASVGFDWPDEMPVFDKIEEEIGEFQEAYDAGDVEEMQNELGDVLFTIVNMARKLDLDAETCLRRTIKKFDTRFRIVEKHFQKAGVNMHEQSLEELDEIWDLAKKTKS